MLLKSKIDTNTNKGIFASYKMFIMGIRILILSFNDFRLSISLTMLADIFVFILDFNRLAHTLMALAHTLVALTHLNSTAVGAASQ